MAHLGQEWHRPDRRHFIGGSDARIIMGDDEPALIRLWREKRGEIEPQDLSDNLIVQLGVATEPLNRLWYERTTGKGIKDVQLRVRHPVIRWMAATLDGVVEHQAPSSRPSSCCRGRSPKKGRPRNTWRSSSTTCGSRTPAAVLSIITGGGKWVEITVPADALYQHLLLTAEKKFWRCVESGDLPRLYLAETPRPASRRSGSST